MLVSKTSPLSGERTELDLPITDDQLVRYYAGRELLQDLFPNLTPYQRDFIKFGFTEEEWNEIYNKDEDL